MRDLGRTTDLKMRILAQFETDKTQAAAENDIMKIGYSRREIRDMIDAMETMLLIVATNPYSSPFSRTYCVTKEGRQELDDSATVASHGLKRVSGLD